MTDQQTSRTNIIEAPDVAAQVAYEMSVFLHGAEMAPPVAPGWLAKIREWQARLAAEPRSDAVTAPENCLNCGKPIAPTHCQSCGECDPTPEARAASASVPPLDVERLAVAINDAGVDELRLGRDLSVPARRIAAAYAAETPEQPCSACHGTRWTEDENWSPDYPESWDGSRSPHNGLIPCGFCNEGGWSTPLAAETPEQGRGDE